MLVGWTFTRTLTPVIMKLSDSPRLRLQHSAYYLNCGPTVTHDIVSAQQRTVLSTGAKVIGHESCLWSEGSTGAKVPWNESSWNIRSWGAKVPRERKFHGTKVLGLFAPRERMFHGTKVPRERKFSLWSFRSLERKCRGTMSVSLTSLDIIYVTPYLRLPSYGTIVCYTTSTLL